MKKLKIVFFMLFRVAIVFAFIALLLYTLFAILRAILL